MYRERIRTCPLCDLPMEQVAVPLAAEETAEVDLCAVCGGVFLEFFDGEPGDLARGVLRHLAAAHRQPREAAGPLTCPDCGTHMAPRPYLDLGPDVGRCDSCLAVFATPPQLRQLAKMVLSDASAAPSFFNRLANLFRSRRGP